MHVIPLKPSFTLAVILILAHGLSVGVVIMLPISIWLELIVLFGIIASLVVTAGKHALLLFPNSIVAFKFESDNVFTAKKRDDTWNDFEILGSSIVLPFLTILNLKATNHCSVMIVFFDAIDKDNFRRLRTILKHGVSIKG